MTKTELKKKLAEAVLPPESGGVVRTEVGDIEMNVVYDYALAERVINFLSTQGVKLDD